jgi:hypothetical protein
MMYKPNDVAKDCLFLLPTSALQACFSLPNISVGIFENGWLVISKSQDLMGYYFTNVFDNTGIPTEDEHLQ